MQRRDINTLTETELASLGKAFNKLWSDKVIQKNAKLHEDSFFKGIHWGPAFLPWHRDFLRKLELALQSHEKTVTLPYWDWTTDKSRDLNAGIWESFFGGRDNKGGKFDSWTYTRNDSDGGHKLPTASTVVSELEAKSFLAYRAMESGTHPPGHRWTGGSMAKGDSPLDPLFYLHHCNLDRLWSIWQINNPKLDQYEHTGKLAGNDRVEAARVPLNEKMIGGATPASMLDHAALGYTYSQDQALETAWRKKHGTEIKTHVSPAVA